MCQAQEDASLATHVSTVKTAKRQTERQKILESRQSNNCYCTQFSDESQDIESLPEQRVGRTNVRRSILRRRISKDPKYTNTAKQFINIRERCGPFWASSRVVPHIVAAPTLLRLQAQTWATDDAKKRQLGNGPTSCTEFAEHTWRTELHSFHQNMEW